MKSLITTQKMKVHHNIGLGLFLFSIASIVFWSPRSFSISHGLGDVIDKVSENGQFFVEKAKNIPFKVDLATKDTIDRMKIDIEDSKDLYRNSLTRTNEENVKPTLNEISNWIGVDQNPSIIQECLNKLEENACEIRTTSKEIGKRNLDISYITSNDLKDTIYGQNGELYKQTTTNFDQSNHAHKVFDKSNFVATSTTSTIEKIDHWIVDIAHKVFDKSGSIIDVGENEVGKIMDTTFEEMDMNKTLKFPNNSISKIVESSKENVCQEDPNENNTLHNNLQFLGTNNTKDSKIDEVKNELNFQKELCNFGNDQESTYNQYENLDEDPKKSHHKVSPQQYEHFQGDYGSDRNYEGAKGRIVKYSHETYRGAKIGIDVDYKTNNYIQHAKSNAHHHYRDGRHKVSEVYRPMKYPIRNFRKNNQNSEDDRDDNDEDFYEEL